MNRASRIRRWPTISAAAVVLVLALVGTAIAESGPATTSASIARVSKRASQVLRKANRALHRANMAVRIARDTSKQQGPKGDTGSQGPKGDTGAQGPPGVSGLQIVETATTENSENEKEGEVSCPPGKRVFGGGASVESEEEGYESVAIDLSAPSSDTGWVAAAHEHTATVEGWELVVYAICGNAG